MALHSRVARPIKSVDGSFRRIGAFLRLVGDDFHRVASASRTEGTGPVPWNQWSLKFGVTRPPQTDLDPLTLQRSVCYLRVLRLVRLDLGGPVSCLGKCSQVLWDGSQRRRCDWRWGPASANGVAASTPQHGCRLWFGQVRPTVYRQSLRLSNFVGVPLRLKGGGLG